MMKRFLMMYETDWTQLNGNPRMGRQLPQMMAQAGFDVIEASASYETFSGAEGRKFVAEVLMGGPLSDRDWVQRVIALGLATQDEIAQMIGELSDWRNLPGAFVATAHFEVVGRKPLHG